MTTYDWTVTIDGVNVSALVIGGGTIDYGRPTRSTGFQAPVAQFELFTQATYPNYAGVWPTIALGDEVIIHVTWDGVTQNRRFTGVVQALDWNPSGLRVTASGTATDWQNLTTDGLGTLPYPLVDTVPDELETTRVQRLVDDASSSISITIEGTPARRVRGIPSGSLSQPLLDAILRVADDCDALLMEDRLGVVHYRTRNFDRPAAYSLPAGIVERDSIDLAYERGSHINAVRVFYGDPDPATGLQDYVYTNDTATYGTIVTVGERIAELYTDIQYQAGATGKASVYLEKNRLAWEIPDVTLLMSQATGVQADAIFDLQENWMVTVGSLPTGCPIASYDGDILGMTDIMSEQDYRIILHLGPRIADTGGTPEEPTFPEDSITGGTESTFEDENGFLWQLHKWETAGSYTFTVNNDVTPEIIAVAGGGKGGNDAPGVGGGGGGAGGLFAGELAFTPGTVSVTVGGPAANTTLAGLTLYAGGAGGSAYGGGSNGGSGGGAGGGTTAAGGTATKGTGGGPLFGSNGTGSSFNAVGHPGGGASGSGISGYTSDITGTSVEYGRGGAAADGGNVYNSPGSGSGGRDYLQPAAVDGKPGAVYLRYRIG